ncbi:MAG: class I SAM-dependent methyltransferase [Hyphomicrobiaceae bacterium]|nr:class I SAM-dependent methyltransferase [Hyphomicrobiaceae bacterium]MCC0023264.1 class I SAM-dependent methyltransferase [Hyphomicrobiaceae bacterium]
MPTEWDQRFDREDYLFGKAPNHFIAAEVGRLTPGSAVLSIADGEGRNGVFLARQGHRVTSMDSSEVAQEKARRLAAEHGVRLDYALADIAVWDWQPERYDAVVAVFIQFASPDLRDRIFAGIKQTLRPGGLLLMEGYRPEQIAYGTGGPRREENLYTEAMLRTAFAGFEIIELKSYDAEVDEGMGHSGMSALIDLIARKP